MSKKTRVIDIEDSWCAYSEYASDELSNRELFNEMKKDILIELSEYVDEYEESDYESILENLEYSADLKEWNLYMDDLFDWADYNNVRIKTGY